ncbi:ArsR family transcriptional regulator, partial [Pseudomonas aeruginosa]|nr:ArsR family transcriptional regulator [Pseudomonas aeruginosa]
APLGENRWHAAGDRRFAPDNLLLDSRNANFIAIVDKASGKVVWRLGPNLPPIDPKSARKLPRPVDQISGQHDAHLIPEGLPGAGNLLVFDNQGDA